MKYILNIVKKIIAYDKKKNNSEILGIGAIAVLPKSIDEVINRVETEEPKKIYFNDKGSKYNPVTGMDDQF